MSKESIISASSVFKWFSGILATIITTYVTAKFITSEPEPLARLNHYDHDYKAAISIDYPDFLAPVEALESEYSIGIRAESSSWGITQNRISVIAIPQEYFLHNSANNNSKSDSNELEEDLKPLIQKFFQDSSGYGKYNVRVLSRWLLSDVIFVESVTVTNDLLLVVSGMFEEEVWDRHKDSLKASIESVKLDQELALSYFHRGNWIRLFYGKDRTWSHRATIWTPKKLIVHGCRETEVYKKIKVHRFECVNNGDTVLLNILHKDNLPALLAKIKK